MKPSCGGTPATTVKLGLRDFAVTSDGQYIAHPKILAKRERNLVRYQCRMARKRRGSANRAEAKAKVVRAHRKVRASRTDFLHRTSAWLVRDHDVIVVEDLAVANRVRNAAKNILVAGLVVATAGGDACGGDVRHSGSSRGQAPTKQEPSAARPGIPALQSGE
jgi:transposase